MTTEIRTQHLEVLDTSGFKSYIVILAAAITSLVAGLIFLYLGFPNQYLKLVSLVMFSIAIPYSLITLILRSHSRLYAKKNIVLDGSSSKVKVTHFELVPALVRLESDEGTQSYHVIDKAFQVSNTLLIDAGITEKNQYNKRRKIVETFSGKEGVLYQAEDSQKCLLIVLDRALELEAFSKGKNYDSSELDKLVRK